MRSLFHHICLKVTNGSYVHFGNKVRTDPCKKGFIISFVFYLRFHEV